AQHLHDGMPVGRATLEPGCAVAPKYRCLSRLLKVNLIASPWSHVRIYDNKVVDEPAGAGPRSFWCNELRDLCPDPGHPVHFRRMATLHTDDNGLTAPCI